MSMDARSGGLAIVAVALLLQVTACSDAVETAKEAVSPPFKVYRDSKSYVGDETIVLARAETRDQHLAVFCRLIRPLTGSFWGGRDDYQAHFNYEWSAGGTKTAGRLAPPQRGETRDAVQARRLCAAHAATVTAREDGAGFDIGLDGRIVATVANDGSMIAR